MNQRDFYNQYVRPYLTDDRPRNRMLFNDAKDMLHREGKITDWQVRNWVYPDTNAFMTPRERELNKRWADNRKKKR
jgi:hypothetical protein